MIHALRDELLPLFDDAKSAHARVHSDASSVDTRLPAIAPLRQVVQDYTSTGLSLKAHPVSFARKGSAAMGAIPAGALRDEARFAHGSRVAVAGIVLVRQRPATASGVMFMTIGDETGVANLIIYPKTFERYRAAAKHGVVVFARGKVERAPGVAHVLVKRVEDVGDLLADKPARSRNFH